MKTQTIILFTFLSVSLFAGRIDMPHLPDPRCSVSEVSETSPLSPQTSSRKFIVEITLPATPTNNVEVSVGSSSETFALSPAETDLTVGWDCGSWFIEGGAPSSRLVIAPVGTSPERSLVMRIDIRENDTIRKISIEEDGAVLNVGCFDSSVMNPGTWKTIKAVSRGYSARSGSVSVKTTPDGLKVIAR